eukprot:scaffold258345_cov13-Tisochrysis_lutea.AAC.1
MPNISQLAFLHSLKEGVNRGITDITDVRASTNSNLEPETADMHFIFRGLWGGGCWAHGNGEKEKESLGIQEHG